ncbi:MAG: hypothetical protein KatS3mg096_755 [Candidatus Parcubacteria bacterium]|nr:MAG: hypothetical protein KatS3mg096_755 [Candidatus Parcubacteria bacterium]
MKKDYTGLLLARISKKEIEEKHPDWLEQYGIVKFIKNEFKEVLKDILLEKIYQQAKEQNYYLYDEVFIRETENSFVAIALTYPKFIPGRAKKLRPPKISPEKVAEIFKEKIAEIGIVGYGGEQIYASNQQSDTNNKTI